MSSWKFAAPALGLLLLAVPAGWPGSSGVAAAEAGGLPMPTESVPGDGVVNKDGHYRYMVRLEAPGALARLRAARGPAARFRAGAPAAEAVLAEVSAGLEVALAAIATVLDREVEPSHRYLVTHSGFALWLTEDEAGELRGRPGVVSVERERIYELDTYRGPEFIGADAIWTGTAVPGGSALTGSDQVIAILDSGLVDPDTHDSFANDPACGHGEQGVPDKVLSMVDCDSTDQSGMCDGPDPIDHNSHGTHVAGIAAGNRLEQGNASPDLLVPGEFDMITGVAPCASIRSYKVCPGRRCPGSHIQAGLNSVLLDGDVSVANFSISGGTSPWLDNDRIKLDLIDAGVLVAASAGNAGTAGSVGHRGPWVVSVAASTRDVNSQGGSASGDVLAGFSSRGPTPAPFENIQKPDLTAPGVSILAASQIRYVSASGPGTPPELTQEIPLTAGSDTWVRTPAFSGQRITYDPAQDPDSDGCDGYPQQFFDNAVALIRRGGECTFTDKINHAVDAGAIFVLIYNNESGLLVMNTDDQPPGIDAFSISQERGEALKDFIDSSGDQAEIDYLIPPVYGFKSGTSMSSPHVAGAAVLVRQARPEWTVMQAHSALRMTAMRHGFKNDGNTTWDADDVGSGRVDLTRAALAGLVMDVTTEAFLDADPASDGDVRTLNLPAIRDMDCQLECSFTRVVGNALDEASSWTVSGQGFGDAFDVSVDPDSFSFSGNPDETRTLTITVVPNGDLTAEVAFGEIVLVEAGSRSPDLHWTVAISGVGEFPPAATVNPTELSFVVEFNGSDSDALTIGNSGDIDLEFNITQAAPHSVELAADNALTGGEGPLEPISLIVDGFNGNIRGVGVNNQSIVWLNRFTPAVLDLPFTLHTVRLMEASGFFGIQAGDVYDVHVWSSADGEPGSGDEELMTSVTGLETGSSAGFVDIALPEGGVAIDTATGDVLIGVVNRTRRDNTFPAISDGAAIASSGRSWAAFNFPGGEPADPPVLSQAGNIGLIDGLLSGRNWLVRGLGTGGSSCLAPEDVPWLSVSPSSGKVAGGQTEIVTVAVNMNGQGSGLHEARLCIETNDPDKPMLVVPITVEVLSDEIFRDRFESVDND